MKKKTITDLICVTPREFVDISDEMYRVYEWESGFSLRIEMPVALNVSESKGHRIFDHRGICHYVPSGWIHLFWEVAPHGPHFVL